METTISRQRFYYSSGYLWFITDDKTLSQSMRLFNASLTTGCFPAKFKHAIVLPLLKEDGLDKDQLKNYRPVSNLPFLSKLLERVIQRQLQRFWVLTAWCRYTSRQTGVIIARTRCCWRCSTIFSWSRTEDKCQHSVCWTWQQRLTRSIMSCYYGDYNKPSESVAAALWHGSCPTYLSGGTYCVVVDSATSQVIHMLCSVS